MIRQEIVVPRDHSNRNDLLRNLWTECFASLAGSDVPAPALRLPPTAASDYRACITHRRLDDITVMDQYSDAVNGLSGAKTVNRDLSEVVVVHQVISGSLCLTDGTNTSVIGANEFCIRDGGIPNWQFAASDRTSTRILLLPKHALQEVSHEEIIALGDVKCTSPEARLLAAQLDILSDTVDGLSPRAVRRTRSSILQLTRGVIDALIADKKGADVLRLEAEGYIDRHLLDATLNPAAVAAALNVSMRTLYRVFETSGESVMAYVRRRRLDHASAELLPPTGAPVSVVASRWHFSDASHFTRLFRNRFGVTPSQYRQTVIDGSLCVLSVMLARAFKLASNVPARLVPRGTISRITGAPCVGRAPAEGA